MIVPIVFLHWFFLCVLSQSFLDGDINLVGSNFSGEGRVEIYHLNKWGTICDDRWGAEESNVVCHQLGYSKGAQYWYDNAFFGRGRGIIWMDDVSCYGNETKLSDCNHNGWHGHNCHHFEDVGVLCLPRGDVSNHGNCDFEKGHGMCGYENDDDDDFDWGFGSRNIQHYRQGPKTDHTTANTTGEGFYLNILFNYYDVTQGQKARLLSPVISSGYARCLRFYYFMGGTFVGELIVYTQKNGQPVWQLIGDQGPDWSEGVIPLNIKEKTFQIVFEGIAGTGYYGSDVSIDDISLTNDTLCILSPVTASPSPPIKPTSTIRLKGSSIQSAGRVEVLHGTGNQARWGTICGYSFDIKAAHVVCKELGYEEAELVVPCCDVFGKGTGHIWMDNVRCLGTEPSITMCPHSGWGKTHCSHNTDVAVICETKKTDKTDFKVRLVDGGGDFKGRVEVEIGGLWGTVSDQGWDIYDANVVCKQLHLGGAVGAYSGSSFGNGKGPIWMSNFKCKGNESSLAKCSHNATQVQKQYGHYYDASVECYDLRLVGGKSAMSGRVEVRYEGIWGTVCDHGWNIKAANVVCRQLGYRRAESEICCAEFGAGSGQIFLDEVQCNGDEPSLSFCRHLGWTAHNCSHHNDAGVFCTNDICSKSNPCLNGGTCSSSSGTCKCTGYYVGETCQVSAGNDTVEVVFVGKLEQWNETSFKQKVVKDLNMYCTKVNCSAVISKGQKTKLAFKVEDIVITEPAKQQDNNVFVGITVLYNDEGTTEVFPKSFVHNFISKSGDKLAGYKVIMVDGQDEGVPAGHHSNQNKDKSNNKYIYIGVGVAVGLIALLVLVFIVKRYSKVLSARGQGRYGDQSYVALNDGAYDDSLDDSALLRPPPNDDTDLMT